MKFSDSIKNISIALAQFQGEVTAAPKDAINPHFKKKYATLDGMITAIRPALAKCGLSFIQNNTEDESGQIGVYTMLIHESGENITFDPVYIPLDKKTAQGIGSALTYSRRYSLGTALGIATDEDDDGNSIEPERKQNQSIKTTETKPELTEADRKKKGCQMMYTEASNKGLTKEEAKVIMEHETGKTSGNDLSLEQLGTMYKLFRGTSADDLKEIATAYLMAKEAKETTELAQVLDIDPETGEVINGGAA